MTDEILPDGVGPSGLYGWRMAPRMSWETEGPVVQVVERTGGAWLATPARYYAPTVAAMDPARRLVIDGGQAWAVPLEDMPGLVAFGQLLTRLVARVDAAYQAKYGEETP